MMKKAITFGLSVVLAASMLTGCTSSKDMKDGTYKAIYSTPDSHNWTDFVEVTVKDSRITAVVFDAVNKDGALKSQDPDYEKAMKAAGYETWPADYAPKLASSLVEKQKADEVDTIAGATTSSNDFKVLVKALSKNMGKGTTAELEVTR